METKIRPCVVCLTDVELSADAPEDLVVLCKEHWFTEDLSEEWEAGDGTVEVR